jgi:hypothetical protein
MTVPNHIDLAPDKTLAQREGFACWSCGETGQVVRPIPGLHTVESAQLFQCCDLDACEYRRGGDGG